MRKGNNVHPFKFLCLNILFVFCVNKIQRNLRQKYKRLNKYTTQKEKNISGIYK